MRSSTSNAKSLRCHAVRDDSRCVVDVSNFNGSPLMSIPQGRPVNVCADDSRLQQYLNEELSEQEEAELQDHISTCSECQTALERAAASRSMWDGLRDHLTWDSAGVPEVNADRDRSVQNLVEYLAPTDNPTMLGRLGTYEVSGIVGQGSTGIVLKAWEPSLSRFVAIKVLSPGYSSNGAARTRFEREGRAVAAVSHEHVVPIYAVSEFRGLPYIVMQYIPGLSLLQRIEKEGPLDTCEVTRVGLQVANALAAAHAQGIVHRDVKPANVLLENTVERAMVTDFGLARVADEASMTRSGTIAGTPQYMSPEQARGEAVDPRSDLFSLGSLMYAACTARPPFRAETVFGVIHRVCNSEPRPIREINPKIDEWLVSFIERLMSKEAKDRFDSAATVTRLLSDELAYLQSPTTAPKPARDWHAGSNSGPKPLSRAAWGVFCAALVIFALLPFGPGLLSGLLDDQSQVEGPVSDQSDESLIAAPLDSSEKEKDKPAQTRSEDSVPEPAELAVEMPVLAGLAGAEIAWTENKDDEWNKSATRVFDQKIVHQLTVEGGNVIVKADIADVVVRHTEADSVEITAMRRVLADTESAAEKFVNELHAFSTAQTEDGLVIREAFQRRQPDPNLIDESMVVLNGKVTANDGKLTKRGVAAQDRVRRVLITIGLPRDSNVEVTTARGDISVGSLAVSVKAKTVAGDITVGHTGGDLHLTTTTGTIDASEGCDGNVFVKAHSGEAEVANVSGDVEAVAFTGNLSLARIQGDVQLNTNGGCSIVEECQGAVDMMATRGNAVLRKSSSGGRVRASGGNILLDQNTGDVYAQSSGGNITINDILGPTSAHAEHGNVFINVSESPSENSSFSARDGNLHLNVAETVAATVETHQGELQGNTELEVREVKGQTVGVAHLQEGGKDIVLSSSTGNVFVNTLPSSELKEGLGGSGLGGSGSGGSGLGGSGLGGSGLGGSGGSRRSRTASKAAIAKSTGEPRAGAIVPVAVEKGDTNVDGYTLYLPESHETHEGTFPVLVYLQGGYGVGGEIGSITNWGLPRLIRDESDLSDERNKLLLDSMIVVSPHITGGDYYDHPEAVRRILDTVMANYKADASRVFLTGLSRGGHGTWGLASRLPDTFAAIAPIAGSPDSITDHGALASSAIWVAQNTGDRFPHEDILDAVEKIEERGEVEFLRIAQSRATGTNYLDHRYVFSSPTVDGHDAWTEMYSSVEFYKWLLKQQRP